MHVLEPLSHLVNLNDPAVCSVENCQFKECDISELSVAWFWVRMSFSGFNDSFYLIFLFACIFLLVKSFVTVCLETQKMHLVHWYSVAFLRPQDGGDRFLQNDS
jgi:hypothetical protein